MGQKIWILNHFAISKDGRNTKFAKFLGKKNNEVKIFCSSFSHKNKTETQNYGFLSFFHKETCENYEKIYVRTPSYKSNNFKRIINHLVFGFLIFLYGLFKRKKPDIIIGSIQHFFSGLAGYFLSRLRSLPFILEVRDFWPETLIGLGYLKEDSLITKVMYKTEKFLFKYSDHIVSVLPKGEKYIKTKDIPSEKITYIPNGLIIDDFMYYKENFSVPNDIKRKLNNDKFNIIYTGAIGVPNKLCILLNTINKLNNMNYEDEIECFIFGDGVKKNELEKLKQKNNINNFHFMGYVDYKFIPDILSYADILIGKLSYNKVHRFGTSLNKLFDYLAAQKEIIYASRPDNEPFSDVKNIHFIKGDDEKELANKIIDIKDNNVDATGIDGFDYLVNNHSYEILTEKYESIIYELI